MIRLSILTATLSVLPACSDQSLKTFNSIPVATITSHDAGDEFMEGDHVTFRGSVSDTDQASNQLRATWYVGSREACATTAPSSEGETECAIVLEVDSTEVRLEVQDPQDAAGSDSISIAIVPTDAPRMNILQPVVGGVYYSDQLITFEGTVTDSEDDPSDLIVTWESSIDETLDVGNEPDSSGSVTGHGYLSEGDHAIELHAEDSTGKTGSDDVVIRVGPPNSTPLCEIRAPENGGAIEEGSLVTFNATVSDADVPADWLSVTWESDKDDELGESTPYSSGEVQFTWSDLSVGTHTITMTVTDEVGATCTDGILFTVSTAPVVALLAPENGDVYSEGDRIAFSAQVSDNEDSETDLTLSWDSDIDGTVSTQGADSSGMSAFTLTSLSAAEHTLTLTVTDPDGLYTTALAYFTINAVPTSPAVIINPDPAQSDDDLVATASGSIDPDGSGIVTYSYAWYESSMLSSASTSATFPASATTKDLIYKVVVTPNDGESDGVAGEAEITIGNTPPVVTAPTISPSTGLTSTGTATCSATATDFDGDTPSLSYTWTNDTEGTTLASESSVTLSPSAVTLGDVLSCQATATDDEGATDSASTSVSVGNSAPSISSVSIAPNPARVTDTLTCTYSGYSDSESDTDSSTLAWTINGASAGSGSTLVGSLSSGDTVVCTVTPHDGTDAGTPVSDTLIISNTPPVLTDATITPNPAYEGDTLTCTPGAASDDDEDTVSYSYAWNVDGIDTVVTTSTLSSTWFNRGDGVSCTVTPTDGTDDGVAVTSEGISISNTPPAITSVSITPISPLTTDTLTCSYGGYSDLDEDPDVSTLAWTINGASAGSGSTLSGSFGRGDTVVCTVTPHDGTDDGTPVSDSVTVLNTPPVLTDVTITPSPAYADDTLTCTPGAASDDDEDIVSYSYAWNVDGIDTVVTTSTLSSIWFDRGDNVSCTVTPTDGTDDGVAVTSEGISISNTPPAISSVSITPISPLATDTLTCSYGGYSDLDEDPDVSTLAWTINGASAGSGSTLSGSLSSDDTVVCIVTPHDGTDAGTPVSDSVTVLNTPPVIMSITLAPSTIYTNDVLAASVVTSDAESDTVSLSYAWYVDDALVSATGSSLDGAVYFDRNQTVHVVVTPNDGTSDGAAGISLDIDVLNTAPTAPIVSIDPTDPYAGTDDLVCLIDTLSIDDDDGDTISYAITWTVDGETLSEGTSTTHETDDTIDGAYTFADEEWVCTVTPNDGSIDGPADSASVTVISGDSDGDGVPDFDDLCPGGDDSIDANGNGIPDACEVYEVFSYTGSAQIFVLPADVSRVFIEADGAKGWTAGHPGGEGGFTSGTLIVSPGDALYVYVGGQGEMSTPAYSPSGAGWNGGGDGQNNSSGGVVGGGGGASDVRLVYASDPLDATSLDSRVLVAAGGGGATSNTNAYGGDGGGLTGEDGGQHSGYHYGRGGTQSGGGDSSGGFGYGGDADGSMTPWNGGGGGGWYGGGVSTAHSGGGGGSSYTGGVTDGTVERGGNNGDGEVTIYWAERP